MTIIAVGVGVLYTDLAAASAIMMACMAFLSAGQSSCFVWKEEHYEFLSYE